MRAPIGSKYVLSTLVVAWTLMQSALIGIHLITSINDARPLSWKPVFKQFILLAVLWFVVTKNKLLRDVTLRGFCQLGRLNPNHSIPWVFCSMYQRSIDGWFNIQTTQKDFRVFHCICDQSLNSRLQISLVIKSSTVISVSCYCCISCVNWGYPDCDCCCQLNLLKMINIVVVYSEYTSWANNYLPKYYFVSSRKVGSQTFLVSLVMIVLWLHLYSQIRLPDWSIWVEIMWQDSTSATIPGGLIVIFTVFGIYGDVIATAVVIPNTSLLGVFIQYLHTGVSNFMCYLIDH